MHIRFVDNVVESVDVGVVVDLDGDGDVAVTEGRRFPWTSTHVPAHVNAVGDASQPDRHVSNSVSKREHLFVKFSSLPKIMAEAHGNRTHRTSP